MHQKTITDSVSVLLALHQTKKIAIQKRLREFSAVLPSDYFYELIYCLLTPQSSAVNAANAIRALQSIDFQYSDVDPEPFLRNKDSYIRFHRTKAIHCVATKMEYDVILKRLTSGGSGIELREWLVQNVKGIGWKEASHFLRNIGYRDLAILDRHILKNLLRIGVVKRLPKTLTPRRYKLLEKKFHTFAQQVGIPMDELDLLFWSLETGEILK